MEENLTAINPEDAKGKEKELFDLIKNKMGLVPNILKTMANAPNVLEAYLGFSAQLQKAYLHPTQTELIALYVASLNQCDYCISAHSYVGSLLNVSSEDLSKARAGKASDPQMQAILSFVEAVIIKRGKVDGDDVNSLKTAGFTEAQIVEISAVIGINMFTNYFNFIAKLENDFPLIEKNEW
jgi:uncharacterized peroxidase-related enzyme